MDELVRLTALVEDTSVWTLADVQAFLGQNRTAVYRLWRNTASYLTASDREWPPSVHDRVAEGDGPGCEAWPPHQGVLPPPDFDPKGARPRWEAGTIKLWALQVGRMLPDGTVVRPSKGRHARARRVLDAPAEELARLERMIADDSLWDSAKIREFFGVSEAQRKWWVTATINRFAGGETSWPPALHERPVAGAGRGLRSWPPHRNLLPPPVKGGLGEGRAERYASYRWRGGDIILWALQTRRLSADGLVMAGGRGPGAK